MNAQEWDRQNLFRFRARVWRIIDGDTFVALPDCGFDVSAFPHIRIKNVFAPELHQIGGTDAKIKLRNVLYQSDDEAWPLRIESELRVTVVQGVKSFARYVAYVYVVKNSQLVSVEDLLDD